MTPAVPWERIETVAKRWEAEKYIPGAQARIAEEYGVSARTIQRWLQTYRAKIEADPATRNAMDAIGAEYQPSAFWAKQQKDGTILHSVLMSKKKETDEDLHERIRQAFEGILPAPPERPPSSTLDDLCVVLPITDVHANMIAKSQATGGTEYNLKAMSDDMLSAVQKIMSRTPDAAECTLLLNGDTLDTDNAVGVTPGHGHVMHKEGSQFQATYEVVSVLRVIIQLLLGKFAKLRIRVLRGNHDESSHIALTFALLGYMSEEPRVTVEACDYDLFMQQWGRCAIFSHHGDFKVSWAEFCLALSDICPWWAETDHRVLFLGHGHNSKRQDFGAIHVEMLRPFAPINKHAADLKYTERRALHSITFDKLDGIVSRAVDPVTRPPRGAGKIEE